MKRWLFSFPVLLLLCGCVANQTPLNRKEDTILSIPDEVFMRVSQLETGMTRSQVDRILEPPTNNFGMVTSGLISEYRQVVPGYKIPLVFWFKGKIGHETQSSQEDVLVDTPKVILVKTGRTDWRGREKWREVSLAPLR